MIISGFWNEDLRKVFREFREDLKITLRKRRKLGAFSGIKHSRNVTLEAIHDIGEMPWRIKRGFAHFKEDFVREIDQLTEPADKTIFTLRVLGSLTSFIVSIVYAANEENKKLSFRGIRSRHPFTQILLTELAVKMSYYFILRFLEEVERAVDSEEDKGKIRFFRYLLTNPEEGQFKPNLNESDPAHQIVEALKNYIVTGSKN